MSTIKHSESFVVRSYEIDQTGAVSLPQIADYFQEAAGRNAHDLNFDISHLQEKGATWVLFRMHIKIEEFPERWEEVTVNTWPSSGDGIRAFRDYELVGGKGNRLGVGVSQWMVLNIENRRPMRIQREILQMNHDVKEHLLPVDKEPFEPLNKPDFETSLEVSRYDIDMNSHVNNVKYIEWMTGYLPEDAVASGKCREIKIQYHKEATAGSRISVVSKRLDKMSFVHHILGSEGDLLAEGHSKWLTLPI